MVVVPLSGHMMVILHGQGGADWFDSCDQMCDAHHNRVLLLENE